MPTSLLAFLECTVVIVADVLMRWFTMRDG